MSVAKTSEHTEVLVPAATESSSPRNAGRVRLAKALATRQAAKIPGMAAPLVKAKKRTSNRVKLSDGDYAQLVELKQRLHMLGTSVKKSQLLLAGLALLVAMNDVQLTKALAKVAVINAGRQS